MNSPAHYKQTTFGADDKKAPPGTYFLFNFPSYLVCLLRCTICLLGAIYLDLASFTSSVIVLLTVFVDSGILLTFMHIFNDRFLVILLRWKRNHLIWITCLLVFFSSMRIFIFWVILYLKISLNNNFYSKCIMYLIMNHISD